MYKKLTTDDFITKAKQIHGDRYDYSLVNYINSRTKVKIVCHEHGVFEQKPNYHLSGRGCKGCGKILVSKKLTIGVEDFIERSNNIHNNKYSYDLVVYKGSKVKVKIVCHEHGVFEQTPDSHLRGSGCPVCTGKKKHTVKSFIDKAIKIHGDRYSYDLVEYTNNINSVKIICPDHGIFEQRPNDHMSGHGCVECGKIIISEKKTMEECDFISRSMVVHCDKYDYSLVKYKNTKVKVKIVCPEHGVFEQNPNNHLNGNGCPLCAKTISKQELDLLDYIKSIYKGEIITNTRQIIYPYELDIYLPDIHKAFEYNGMYWHTEGFTKPVGYHQMKNDLCSHRGINLMHVWEHDWMNDNRFMKEVVRREVLCGR